MDEDEAKGKGRQIKGKIREETGDLIDDEEMEAKGKIEQAKGKAQEKTGKIKRKLNEDEEDEDL